MRRWPVIPAFVIVVFGLATIFTTQFATDDPNKQNLRGSFAPPFWYDEYYENNERLDSRYFIGADQHGRDIYLALGSWDTRFDHGRIRSGSHRHDPRTVGRDRFRMGSVGGSNEIMTRFVDVWNGLPFLLVALVVAITIGTGLTVLIGLLVMATWGGIGQEYPRGGVVTQN